MEPREIPAFERALEQITQLAEGFGLDFFEMRYEVCPADVLYSFGAYGMPARFPHWSFGKAYHRMKMHYDFNLSRIYELVINSDPCYAFLLETNTLLQNKVIAAHVLAHSDFFKHNARFSHTSRDMVERMALNAGRIREHEFRYGRDRVEEVLDAALALQYHVDPYLLRHPRPRAGGGGTGPGGPPASGSHGSSRPSASGPPYEDLWALDGRLGGAQPRAGNGGRPGPRDGAGTGGLEKECESATDLLLFIAERSRSLEPWEREVLHIVRQEMLYFYPQLETKIMNEGWASLWHARIMRALDLPAAEAVEYAKMHANVLQPNRFGINPYRLGYETFLSIEERWGTGKIFEVRENESDVSFLRNYLTEELVESLDLYLYQQVDGDWVVVEKDWEAVRDQLVRQASHCGIPRIVVIDDDYRGNGELVLEHRFEGEELDQRYVDKTMPFVHRLWGRAVHLRTVAGGKPTFISYDGRIQRPRREKTG